MPWLRYTSKAPSRHEPTLKEELIIKKNTMNVILISAWLAVSPHSSVRRLVALSAGLKQHAARKAWSLDSTDLKHAMLH